MNATVAIGSACFVANKPRSTKPRACRPVPPAPKLEARLPYRAYDFAALSLHVWSRGQTVRQLERREPRGIEKPVEDMTLDELISTQSMEPLSESRRAFLTTGQGVLSLDAPSATSDEAIGTIAETVADDSALRAFAAVEGDELDDAEHDAHRFGTPYTQLDPVTARQIEWERERAQESPTRVTRITAADDGSLRFTMAGRAWPTRDQFVAAARRVRDSLFATYGRVETYEQLQARADLLAEGLRCTGVTRDFVTPDPEQEAARFAAPADAEWHSSYARPQRVALVQLDDEGTERIVGHTRITRLVHRGSSRSKDEFWHTGIPDVTAFEMGTDGLVDPIVSDLGTY